MTAPLALRLACGARSLRLGGKNPFGRGAPRMSQADACESLAEIAPLCAT